MAREKIITRTIASAEVELTVYDKSTKQSYNGTYQVPVFKKVTDLEKWLDKNVNNDAVKWVDIGNVNIHEDRYAMSETDFIKYGYKMTKEDNN